MTTKHSIHLICRLLFSVAYLLLFSACRANPSPFSAAAPTITPVQVSLIGRPLIAVDNDKDSRIFRLMEGGQLRHISDQTTYAALGYQAADLVKVTTAQLHTYPLGLPLTRWVTSYGNHALYLLQNGKRYQLTDSDMLTVTGGLITDVSLVTDSFLNSFPTSDQPIGGLSSALAAKCRHTDAGTGVMRVDAWTTDDNFYDFTIGAFHIGHGLITGSGHTLSLDASEFDPLKNITALLPDRSRNILWVGTRSAGLLRYDLNTDQWTRYNRFNSTIGDDDIRALSLATNGDVWMAMPAGLGRYNGSFTLYPVPDDVTDKGVFTMLVTNADQVWAAGENFIGHFSGKTEQWALFDAFDNPILLDRFQTISQTPSGDLWFSGNDHLIRWQNGRWSVSSAADSTIDKWADFLPEAPLASVPNFSPPQKDYLNWLKTWPRPRDDNGRGMHYLAYPTNEPLELYAQIDRLKILGIRWLLVNYTSRAQLPNMAKAFTKAGIMVIWRPFVRPYREYAYWAQDVAFLRAYGIPPYIQIYNEPSLGQEWEDDHRQVDGNVYLSHMLPAMRQVYDAGGYVGIQQIDQTWLRTLLENMKANHEADIFQRTFFIPHAYGYNHPPELDRDENSVLGFRNYAQVFRDEVGWVPMMIAGEGGWRPGEAQDVRYPPVTITRQRDYLLAVFQWFQTGKLSNGEQLPDYFFGFCSWILSDPNDTAAWYDGPTGDKWLAIQAVEQLPGFVRKFSWDTSYF